MTGLLRKDLYYVKAYAWPYLPLLALLCLSPGAMGPAYAMALSFPAQNAALRLMGRTEAMWGAELNLPAYVLIQVWLTALIAAGTLPLLYRLGARAPILVNILVMIFLSLTGTKLHNMLFGFRGPALGAAAAAMALAGAGAMVLSFRVSVGFYRARLRGRFG